MICILLHYMSKSSNIIELYLFYCQTTCLYYQRPWPFFPAPEGPSDPDPLRPSKGAPPLCWWTSIRIDNPSSRDQNVFAHRE